MLRRYEAFAPGCSVGSTRTRTFARCSHVGLACLALLVVSAPTALAAPKDAKPAPQKLWEAFPLNPTGERLGGPAPAKPVPQKPVPAGPLLPPTTTSSPQETQAAGDDAQPAAGTDMALFALAAGLLLFLAASLVTVRLRAGHGRVRSAPLWQGTAGLEIASGAGARPHPDIAGRLRQRPRLARPRVTRTPTASRELVRRGPSPRTRARNLSRAARRMREVVWTADTAPAIVGAAIAVVLAVLIIRFVG